MIRINLLPVRAARKRENIRRQVSVFILSIFFVLVVMTYVTIDFGRKISDLNVKIEDAQGELRKLQAISKKVNEIKAKLEKLQAKTDIIGKLEADRDQPIRIMEALTGLVVADKMWLTSLTEAGEKMDLMGVAMDNKTIADFMTRLEKSPYFKVVDLISSKQVKEKDKKFKKFKITCRLSVSEPKTGPKAS